MSGSPTRGGKNVVGIPGACVTPNFTYLARRSLRVATARVGTDVITIFSALPAPCPLLLINMRLRVHMDLHPYDIFFIQIPIDSYIIL